MDRALLGVDPPLNILLLTHPHRPLNLYVVVRNLAFAFGPKFKYIYYPSYPRYPISTPNNVIHNTTQFLCL